jgi:hypothetical protein
MPLIRNAIVAAVLGALATSAAGADSLRDGFSNPPPDARPRVWWHWMNGNVTKEGIAKDLDWMQRVGIGGLQNFDASLNAPQIVDKRLVYMTPEWQEAFRFAATLAQEKGLEFAIAASPGWSETGGPWVKPENAIKKLVWSETTVTGGRPFNVKLPAPPKTTGPFQDVPLADDIAALGTGHEFSASEHYSDVAVLAYRIAHADSKTSTPRVTLGDGKPLDAAMLADGRFAVAVSIDPGTPDRPQIISIDYEKPQTIRSATVFFPGLAVMFFGARATPRLEVAEDGGGWRKIVDITPALSPTTVNFAPVTARKFRVVVAPNGSGDPLSVLIPAPGADVSVVGSLFGQSHDLKVAEIRLTSEAKVDQFESKSGFSIAPDYYALDSKLADDSVGIAPADVVNLTARMQPDGTLNWTPPKGSWRVLRLGWSLTGKKNHPATAEATGLEVDKMDAAAVRGYLEQYLRMYKGAAGTDLFGQKGLRALMVDSTEVGAFNWTPKMIEQFQRLRGYDPTPWLPTLTGAIIGSHQQSDAFLYDFRRTIADLHASEHYGTIAQVAHEQGLRVYGESLEGGRTSLGDDMEMRRFADYPMSALWTYLPGPGPQRGHLADMKGASSVAHVYGQNIAAAESMTSALTPWGHSPADLRPVIDLEFASGINRPVIHTSVHQPVDDKVPGLALMIFGQYFNRHETWAEFARPWIDYIARTSFLLQKGRNVADVAYFSGEEAPLTALYADAPTSYAYDFVNANAVINSLAVTDAELVSKGGARYKLLYLGGSSYRMTLPTLRRIAELVEAGATVVGAAPESSPSLNDDPTAYAVLRKKLWSGQSVTRVGRGRVIEGKDVEAALAAIGITPDFAFTKAAADSQVLFVHRAIEDGEVYFINNRKDRAENIETRFRVTGKQPQIWRADTDTIEDVSFRIEAGETVVPLEIAAEDSFFVVFRKPASATSITVSRPALQPLVQLDGAWDVKFQPNRGAPPSVRLEKLGSLSEQSEPGVKYFSGIATYTKQFALPKGVKPGRELMLDLGTIGDVAEVRVNGQLVGTAWHAIYRFDIGKAVKAGANTLEVRVANLWVNRLIGDAQPGEHKITWTALPTYMPEAPLRPSGLIGPVRLFSEQARAK